MSEKLEKITFDEPKMPFIVAQYPMGNQAMKEALIQAIEKAKTTGYLIIPAGAMVECVPERKPVPDEKKVGNAFAYMPPSQEQIDRMMKLRIQFSDLHSQLLIACPPGRYRSLALTALEEAALWVNKSITHDGQ